MKIVRTKTKATGGITDAEREKMSEISKKWIDIAFRTKPIEPDKIIPAIKALYRATNLNEPIVVIVPSPFVMALAGGFSSAIWKLKKDKTNSVTHDATDTATAIATAIAAYTATHTATAIATDTATYIATDTATRNATAIATAIATDTATDNTTANATDTATYTATDNATRNATDIAANNAAHIATRNATDIAANNAAHNALTKSNKLTKILLENVGRWSEVYQGGNMWAGFPAYIEAMRDVLGLDLPEYKKYQPWEDCAKHGGFRYIHEKFCIVSDFPEYIKLDDRGRPHCETGPSHRWRDGFSIYSWHGVQIPMGWIEDKSSLKPETALKWENIEQRRAACEIIGWDRILAELNAETINKDDDPMIGELVEVTLPDAGKERFLRVLCGTGRRFAIPVPREMKTALQANAWSYDMEGFDFRALLEVRT